MNEQQLREIEERATAATPGPWEAIGFDNQAKHITWLGDADGGDEVADLGAVRNEDAIFIATCRKDIPALIAEVRRLQAKVEALEEHLSDADLCTVCGRDLYAERTHICGGFS